ncbi:MAG: Gfo/Idh/MocA family protein [Fastidiosipilaceae bacterium]|jgi:UDP-N-acetyl-2-amino-2-deoxyglucuronate dehydrogenase
MKKVKGANMQYNLALIGCGRVAEKHLKAIRHNKERLNLIAVVDLDPAKVRNMLDRFLPGRIRGARVFSDVTEMMEATRPDIAAITTPSGTHYEIAKQIIQKGVHVLIEKPMTLDIDEARELTELAKEHKVQIIMGHIYRYLPLTDLIHADVASGRLGKVYSGDVKVRWGHGQEYYDQAGWRGTWAHDGGALMNQTVHACDLMCWLMNDYPVQVSGMIERMAHRMEAEDYGAAVMRMASGAICMVEGTTNNSPRNRGATFYVITEKAEIEAGIHSGKIHFKVIDHEGKKQTRKYYGRLLRQIVKNGGLRALKRLINPHSGIYFDLINCIDNNETPRADGHSGVQSVETILAIYQSAVRSGQPVALPLEGFKLEDMDGYFDSCSDSRDKV